MKSRMVRRVFGSKYYSFRRGNCAFAPVSFGYSKFEITLNLEADVTLAVGYESATLRRGLGWGYTLSGHEQ